MEYRNVDNRIMSAFFFQAEDGIRDDLVTGVQTCALPILADDKSMYVYVPDLVAYYLSERPLLDPVPTYRCSDPDERASVLGRLDKLVTKPVDGHGGSGVLIGPHATDQELEGRRRD